MVTRAWRVYGADGHRQRESFGASWGFKERKGEPPRRVKVFNSDVTGTNDYSLIVITSSTAAECERRLQGQISDGVFENSRTGRVEEVNPVMSLEDTAMWMVSDDHRKRFAAEYLQTVIREERLAKVIERIADGTANFVPNCSIELLEEQRAAMLTYLYVLEERAKLEQVDVTAARWLGRC